MIHAEALLAAGGNGEVMIKVIVFLIALIRNL